MQKVVVIGVDGATLDLMESWMNEGKLPNFEKIRENGVWGKLSSTIPPFSAPAWTSIITGCNPGKHGIYGFERTDTLESHFINSRYRKAPAIWNFLTDIGMKNIIVNVPGTFPPEKINGIMITGLLTPSPDSNFTYPQEIKKRLTEKDLGNFEFEQLWVEDFPRSFLAKHSPDKLAAHISKEMVSHATVAINLMKQFDWDFTMVVLRGTDTAQHYLWHRKDILLSCYQKVDQLVGEIMSMFPEAVFFIVSDHGFEEIKKILYPDNVLYNAGLLKPTKPLIHGPAFIFWSLVSKIENFILRRLPPQAIKRSSFIRKVLFSSSSKNVLIDFSKTKAFSTADGRGIQINQKKRYNRGTVDEEECQKLCSEIRKLFSELRDPDNNEKIIEEVYQWNEIYGKNAIYPPDLILKLKKGFTSAEWLRKPDNFKRIVQSRNSSLPNTFEDDSAGRTGDHAPFGVFFAHGKNIRKGYQVTGIAVEDLLPLVLATLGISSPKSIDGKLREDVFSEKPIIKVIDWETHSSEKPVLSQVELKKIRELRNMLKSK